MLLQLLLFSYASISEKNESHQQCLAIHDDKKNIVKKLNKNKLTSGKYFSRMT